MVSLRVASAAVFATAMLILSVSAYAAELKFVHVMNIGSEGVAEGQFKYIEDFAFTKDGRLLVTDASHAWVQVFDKTSGQFVTRFGGKGDGDDQLDKPEGIAVDPDGYVYVADYSTGFVKKYDPSFKWVLTFSEYGAAPGQNMKSEFMDIRAGRLYQPDVGNNRVNVFDLNGKPLFEFGGPGSNP
jgi:sugar lactone lactonase YvrE